MKPLRIAVCLKQVLDPELPPASFRIDAEGLRPDVPGAPLVMDSYAANALEVGLKLREQVAGSTLTVFCVGDERADEVIRQAFEVTADEGVRAWDPGWERLDALATAHILARAIVTAGGADVVLCGREAGDIEEGLVGPALAEELDAACVTVAERVAPGGPNDWLVVEKRGRSGLLRLAAEPPLVVTITSTKDNVLRMAKVKDKMLARRKRVRVVGAGELGLDPARARPRTELCALTLAESRGTCQWITGADGAELAAQLVRRLRELKLC
ncbi:MAG TPA: electron transfer flavoprotein subunit beta/FixA family protein [Bacillota bacterium]